MKFNLITLVFLGLTTTGVYAQAAKAPVGLGAKANIEALESAGIGKTYDDRYEGTKGSPFMNENFLNAKIVLNNKVELNKLPVKYNVYDNTILYKDEAGKLLTIGANAVSKLTLTDSNITMQKLEGVGPENAKIADYLFVYLFDGARTKFVSLPAKELVKADFKGSSYSANRTYDEFIDRKEYYLKKSNGGVEKIKLNKKALLKSLSDKEDDIKTYISKEKIDASTEEGWIKTLAYYETL